MTQLDEKEYEIKMGAFWARVSAYGVAAIKVSDGEMFGFTRAKLLDLLNAMTAQGKAEILVFVKTGEDPRVH